MCCCSAVVSAVVGALPPITSINSTWYIRSSPTYLASIDWSTVPECAIYTYCYSRVLMLLYVVHTVVYQRCRLPGNMRKLAQPPWDEFRR